MTWFEDLTGVRETSPEDVRRQLAVEGEMLTSRANGRSWACGRLETPTLGELRARATAVVGAGDGAGGLGAGGTGEGGTGDGGDGPGGERGGVVRVTLREVVADVQALHADPANAGALFQVDSQFNLLEMTSPHVTPEQGVGGYEHDHTQGPACAIACGAGTIYRNYFAEVDGAGGVDAVEAVDAADGPPGRSSVRRVGQSAARQIDCLADLGAALGNGGGGVNTPGGEHAHAHVQVAREGHGEDGAAGVGTETYREAQRGAGRLWTMRNGYALASERGLVEIGERLRGLDEAGRDALRAKLRIGLQWDTQVTLGEATHRVSQAYCSALPVAYSRHASALWEPFARLVLEASCEATLWAGVMGAVAARRLASGPGAQAGVAQDGGAGDAGPDRGRVYLTLLGGGAFGNETAWITDALARAVGVVRGEIVAGKGVAGAAGDAGCAPNAGVALDVSVVSYGRSKAAVREMVRRVGVEDAYGGA